MKLTNLEVKRLQERLQDIIQNIDANMEIISNEEISMNFLQPIMKVATEMSDKIFIQTKDTINEVDI
jgi:hypothetical protein